MDLGPVVLASDSGPYTKANFYGSGEKLPFTDSSFEIVHFLGLLHHLEKPEDAWSEIVRVAGRLIIGVEPSKFHYGSYTDRYHKHKGFWKSQLTKLCKDPRVSDYRIMYYANNPFRINLHITAFKRKYS